MKTDGKLQIKTSSTQFKFSIFKEGMNQIKIGGIIYTLLCAFFGFMGSMNNVYPNPTYNWHSVVNNSISNINEYVIPTLAFIIGVFVVMAYLIIFNMLRSAKGRDFYLSTPNSICTLWLGFSAAIFAWTAIGIAAAGVVEIPFILISDVKYMAQWFPFIFGMLIFALQICGIMSMAISLTGKIVPLIITAASIGLMPSMVFYLFLCPINSYFENFNFFASSLNVLHNPIFDAIDIYVGHDFFSNITTTELFCSMESITSGILTSAIYLAIAAFFMTVRTGDSVGKAFVNKAAHIISLIIITVDIACVAGVELIQHIISTTLYSNYYYNASVEIYIHSLILIFCVAIAFWITEILITFDIKKSYRALKFMPITFAVVLLIMGGGFLWGNTEIHINPSADEIESFTLVRNSNLDDRLAVFRMSDSYGRTITNETEFTDKKVISYVADHINDFIEDFDKNPRYLYNERWSEDESDGINMKIKLKNGNTIYRKILLDDNFINTLENAIKNDSEFMKNFLSLPDPKYTNIGTNSVGNFTNEKMLKVYETFVNEFSALDNNSKLEFLKYSLYYDYFVEDMYYNEEDDTYYDENGSYPETFNNDNVSDSDSTGNNNFQIVCKNKSYGGFGVYTNVYNPKVKFNDADILNLDISGYKDCKFFDKNAYFSQSFTISPSMFPKTIATFTEICNEDLKKFIEIKDKLGQNSVLSISARYYNGKNMLGVTYEYIDKATSSCLNEMNGQELNDYYNHYYNDYDYIDGKLYRYDDYDNQIEVNCINIEIDGKKYADKLFEDAAKTKKIDLTKPYCKVRVTTSNSLSEYTLFIQTESLMDLLDIQSIEDKK